MPVTKSFFQKIPFLRITSLFLTGILLHHYFPGGTFVALVLAIIAIPCLLVSWFSTRYNQTKPTNALLFITLILIGYYYPTDSPKKTDQIPSGKTYFLAEVIQKPKEKKKSFQSLLLIQSRSMINPEKVISYFSKTEFDSTINIGDQLIVRASPQKIKNMGNPFEFDYQKMMQGKGIEYSVYLSNADYRKTGINYNRFKNKAEQLREKLIAKLTSAIPEKKERSVISALTLGYRLELAPETIDYFTSTGAMHVLAVSGLHVGLIYYILSILFSWIRRRKYGNFLYPCILIILLWCYAAITGFSASVQRATVMFTFIIVGEVLRRPINIYNSLSASAFLLMLLNPEIIFEIGFQLSYIAVLGIVLIQPRISKLMPVKNRFLKFLWDLFTVSIAAQLATFPLGILYFNQFPNLFWISNFVVIPGATLIIWLAFIFFLTSPFPVIAQLIANILSLTTYSMISILKFLSELPYALSEGIQITVLQTYLIYFILISILAFALSKRKNWIFYGLIVTLAIQLSTFWDKTRIMNQKTVYVYNSSNNLIHFINGRNNYIVQNDQDSISDIEKRMIQNVVDKLHLNSPVTINYTAKKEFQESDLRIIGNQIYFLNCSVKVNNKPNKKEKKANFNSLKFTIHTSGHSVFSTQTIATENSYSTGKQTTSNDYSTKQKGAFILNLN